MPKSMEFREVILSEKAWTYLALVSKAPREKIFFLFIRLAVLKLLATTSSTIRYTREMCFERLIPLQPQRFPAV
jgi:hypothetical protein